MSFSDIRDFYVGAGIYYGIRLHKTLSIGKLTKAQVMIKLTLACKFYVKFA